MSNSEIIYTVIFYVFGLLTIGSACIVAFSRNILHSAFALLLTFFGVAGLYVFLQADFLAAAQVVIYVGGILVLILFAVMLTNKITDIHMSNPATKPWLAAPLVLIVFAGLTWLIVKTDWAVVETAKLISEPTVEKIGYAIMGKYLLPFELISVLLLGALLGAAYLARPKKKD
ncbi:MAG: NADH-quinone oxidoreductase subunit J [Planctomycetes bacterium]|nr:NADH-quinone oxidoreductase subunit J [Planctomycetota bacterium]